LATYIRPIAAIDLRWREQERMFLPAIGDAVANDEAGIADRFRDRQDLELGQGKIAERVEIVHLAAHIKEGMLGAVSQSRRADDHSMHVMAWAGNAVSGTGRAAERSQVCDGVTQLRFGARSYEKEDGKERREAEVVFIFHGVSRPRGRSPVYRSAPNGARKKAAAGFTSSATDGITR
jgi:hypothetical protein